MSNAAGQRVWFWAPRYKKMSTNWRESRGGPPRQSGGWSTCPARRGWGNGACSARRWEGSGGPQSRPSVPMGRAAKTREPGSLPMCIRDNERWWPWTESGEVLTWYARGMPLWGTTQTLDSAAQREAVGPLLSGPARQWPEQPGQNSLSSLLWAGGWTEGLLRSPPACKVLPTCSQRPKVEPLVLGKLNKTFFLLLMRNVSLLLFKRPGDKIFFFLNGFHCNDYFLLIIAFQAHFSTFKFLSTWS